MTRFVKHADNWKFWMWMFGIGLVVAFALVVYALKQQTHEQSVREATTRATDSAQVAQCFSSVKQAPLISGFIDAHLALIDNSIESTTEALKHTVKTDPFFKIRVQSLVRLHAARENALALQETIAAQILTKAKCIKLAKNLGVPYKQYLPT